MRYRYDHETGKMVEVGEQTKAAGPYIRGDIPAYVSPLGTGVIDGRSARREDMKRGNVREVDPSERPHLPVKTKAQAAEERAQLDARRANPFALPEHERQRLMRG